MPSLIVYCDRCGRLVHASDLEKGAAISTQTNAVCAACAAELTPDQRAAFEAEARRAEHRPATHSSGIHRRHHARPAATSSTKNLLVFAVAGGAVIGLIVAVIVFAGGGSPETGSTPPAPAPPPVSMAAPAPRASAPAPVATARDPVGPPSVPFPPAAAGTGDELAAIKAMIDPTLSKYADIRTALTYYISDHEGTPEAREAKALLEEIDKKLAIFADAEFAKAVAASRELQDKKRYKSAASVVKAVGNRYGIGPWYGTKGRGLIEGELERIRAAKGAHDAASMPVVAIAGDEIFKATFENGVAGWRGEHVTTGLPAGSRGAIRQIGGKGIASPGNWEPGHFLFDPDYTLQYRFYTRARGWHQLMISLRTPSNGVKNLFYEGVSRKDNAWETRTCRLSQSPQAAPENRGWKVTSFNFLAIRNEDIGLTVTDIRVTAPAAARQDAAGTSGGRALYEVDFEDGLPKGWKGTWVTDGLPPGSRGAIKQDGPRSITGPTRGGRGLFTTTPNMHVTYQYLIDKGKYHHMAMVLHAYGGKKQIILFRKAGIPNRRKWHTASFRLSSCRGFKPDAVGRPVFGFSFEPSRGEDSNLTIDDVRITDGPPAGGD